WWRRATASCWPRGGRSRRWRTPGVARWASSARRAGCGRKKTSRATAATHKNRAEIKPETFAMRPLIILIGLVIAVLVVGPGVRRLFRLGMHKGYAPAQPIAFSHKLHAGDNQVPCLYCHYGARSSRHAGIPSSSVCMNCHGLLEKQTIEIERFKEAAQ